MGLTVGQMYLNILLPILLVNVMYWGAGDTTGLPEQTIETLNARTTFEWISRWFPEIVPVAQCTQLSVQQIVDYACLNDYYYDAEATAPPPTGRRRRQTSIFLTHREASNFLRSKRFRVRGRRSTTISAECCDKDCIWEEVGEYCYHPREYHLP